MTQVAVGGVQGGLATDQSALGWFDSTSIFAVTIYYILSPRWFCQPRHLVVVLPLQCINAEIYC